jgi:cobalt/nickel transport system permease protein
MHIDALDSYRPGESALHRLDPRVKLVLSASLILTAALTPDRGWTAFALLELLLLLTVFLSRVGFGLVQRRSAVALPFTLAALTVMISTPGRALLTLPLGGAWAITDTGLLRFLSIVTRSYLSVQTAVLMAATTPFPDILWGMRALRVPRVLVSIGSFLYRYLFVLADEAQRMMRAREARSAAPETRAAGPRVGRVGGSLSWRARVTGGMAGTLFLRSYERSERIYAAMVTRGYDGEIRALSAPALRPADVLIGALAGLLLVTALVLGRGGT